MEQPVALKIMPDLDIEVRAVQVSDMLAKELGLTGIEPGPAILVAKAALDVSGSSTVLVDRPDISAVYNGDASHAILLILPQGGEVQIVGDATNADGDTEFLREARLSAPHLAPLAESIIASIRSKGVEGSLIRKSSGRWINDPVNSFTLKIQPRAKNIHFTIYGNPWTFEDESFLKRDQNSYSRGSVCDFPDVERFARLVAESYSRRSR